MSKSQNSKLKTILKKYHIFSIFFKKIQSGPVHFLDFASWRWDPWAKHQNRGVKKNGLASGGFTLLEMIVSIGIFSVLIVVAIGIVLSISNAQIKAANVQNIQDNIRFTLELITKELRVGSGYAVSSCTGNFCQQINFTTTNGEQRGYCLESGVVKRLSGTAICGFGSPMTSSNIIVDRMYFIVSGIAIGSSDGQPSITVVLQARSADPRQALESTINLQTTVVQRLRDI